MLIRGESMENLLKPLTVIPRKKINVICWIVFIILFSNLGVIFSIFDALNKGDEVKKIFIDTCKSGGFYLNGISLLASYIGTIFIDFFNEDKNTKFISYKIFGLIMSAVILVLMSGNYSSIHTAKDIVIISYWIQAILYLISIFIGLYVFCISCIELKDQYSSYAERADEERNDNIESANNLEEDEEGNLLD